MLMIFRSIVKFSARSLQRRPGRRLEAVLDQMLQVPHCGAELHGDPMHAWEYLCASRSIDRSHLHLPFCLVHSLCTDALRWHPFCGATRRLDGAERIHVLSFPVVEGSRMLGRCQVVSST